MSGIDVLPGLRTYSPEDAALANALGPARIYPLAEARLLEDIVEAAREHVAYADERSRTRAERALDALAAHRKAQAS